MNGTYKVWMVTHTYLRYRGVHTHWEDKTLDTDITNCASEKVAMYTMMKIIMRDLHFAAKYTSNQILTEIVAGLWNEAKSSYEDATGESLRIDSGEVVIEGSITQDDVKAEAAAMLNKIKEK